MVPVAKIGAVVAVVGVGLTGTYFMVFGMDPMPKYELVGTTTSYSSKIGDTYKHFLVDTTKKNKNDKWWEWSYRRWKKESSDATFDTNRSDEFKKAKIDKAFVATGEDAKALNKVCDAAYKKADTDVDFGSGSENKYKLAADLLKYCSPLGQFPVAIGEQGGYGSGKIGETNKADLPSTKDKKNDMFWKLKNDWFKALTTDKPSDEFFKPYLTGESNANKTIKEACEKAYSSTKAESTATVDSPSESDVKKYCGFKKTS